MRFRVLPLQLCHKIVKYPRDKEWGARKLCPRPFSSYLNAAEIVRDGKITIFILALQFHLALKHVSQRKRARQKLMALGDMSDRQSTLLSDLEYLESNGWSMRDIVQVRAFALAGKTVLISPDLTKAVLNFLGQRAIRQAWSFVEVKDLVVDGWLVK